MTSSYDVLVVGGGPGGSTAALRAARSGLRVAILEKSRHPRFHVGESLLPRQMMLIRELGLEAELDDVPRIEKRGASFAMGDDEQVTSFPFTVGLIDAPTDTLNVERAGFDRALARAASANGAELIENAEVTVVESLDDDGVRLTARVDGHERPFAGRYLIDASGQSTLVGRHLGTRSRLSDLERVAYFGHYEHVERDEGELAGFPLIVMCREGWFWSIPLDERRTSIGLVATRGFAKRIGLPSKRVLGWAIRACPVLSRRTRASDVSRDNGVVADFSYVCRPYAGPGYFLVGDAATFVDPIFSTGVTLAMMSGVAAADAIAKVLAGGDRRRAARGYRRYVESSSTEFFRLVRGYYRHAFRELLLNREGPLSIHRAVISVLCGHVFPRAPFAVRWRLRLFEMFTRLQAVVPLVPRRAEFSLLEHATAAGLTPSINTLENGVPSDIGR